jgi:hypothetical protein
MSQHHVENIKYYALPLEARYSSALKFPQTLESTQIFVLRYGKYRSLDPFLNSAPVYYPRRKPCTTIFPRSLADVPPDNSSGQQCMIE